MSIAMIFAEGFEESEAIVPADLLRRAGIDLLLCGLESPVVTGAHGISVEMDCTFHELPQDLKGIILPGGMPGATNLAASHELSSLIQQLHNDSELVAAICASPAVVLLPTGILEGRRFTSYPGMTPENSHGQYMEERVVVDGNIITSRGIGTSAEFGFALVEYLAGKQKAQSLIKGGLFITEAY